MEKKSQILKGSGNASFGYGIRGEPQKLLPFKIDIAFARSIHPGNAVK
jgi:hypothetical protein